MASARTDPFFWRIVPVGFGTAALSGALLSLYTGLMNPFARIEHFSVLEVVLSILSMSAVAVLFSAIAFLPLAVIWNVFLRPLKRRFGLQRGAVILSSAIALLMALALALFGLGLKWHGFWMFLTLLIWLVSTSGIAGTLTYIAFRHRTEALPT